MASLGTPAHGSYERAPERRTLRPADNREPHDEARVPPQVDRLASERMPCAHGKPRPSHRHLPRGSHGRCVRPVRSPDIVRRECRRFERRARRAQRSTCVRGAHNLRQRDAGRRSPVHPGVGRCRARLRRDSIHGPQSNSAGTQRRRAGDPSFATLPPSCPRGRGAIERRLRRRRRARDDVPQAGDRPGRAAHGRPGSGQPFAARCACRTERSDTPMIHVMLPTQYLRRADSHLVEPHRRLMAAVLQTVVDDCGGSAYWRARGYRKPIARHDDHVWSTPAMRSRSARRGNRLCKFIRPQAVRFHGTHHARGQAR